ncbi:MAG: isoprenylcysteine carboxylmethyltransferase family protein [Ardenticatenaceae bacterium]|nr:isoprenylcysteine carboxylmethyltransferase family protein [Ardenticatenaceae bacterium]
MDKKHPWWQGPRGEGYVVIQFLLFALVAFGPETAPGLPRWSAPWSTVGVWLGLAIGLVGAGLVLAGLLWLGRNLTAVPHPKADSTLVQSGAYAIVRHPIYSGIILGAFGLGLLKASTLVILYALILFLFFDIKSRREEQWLAAKFSDYAQYQQRVRKLIPFVY